MTILNNLITERSVKLKNDSMRFAAALKRIESRGHYLLTTLNNVEDNKVDRESLIKFAEITLDILANESVNSVFKCNMIYMIYGKTLDLLLKKQTEI